MCYKAELWVTQPMRTMCDIKKQSGGSLQANVNSVLLQTQWFLPDTVWYYKGQWWFPNKCGNYAIIKQSGDSLSQHQSGISEQHGCSWRQCGHYGITKQSGGSLSQCRYYCITKQSNGSISQYGHSDITKHSGDSLSQYCIKKQSSGSLRQYSITVWILEPVWTLLYYKVEKSVWILRYYQEQWCFQDPVWKIWYYRAQRWFAELVWTLWYYKAQRWFAELV
jgi:hypothetical protein